jgi:hypothetical protein
MTEDPDDQCHALVVLIWDDESFVILLMLDGVTSYFPTFKPTKEQYETAQGGDTMFVLTYDSPESDPHEKWFLEQENSMVDSRALVHLRSPSLPVRLSSVDTMLTNHEDLPVVALNQCCIISETHSQNKNDNTTDAAQVLIVKAKKAPRLDPATLARCCWGTGLAAAAKTIENTTHRAFCTLLNPSLSHCFRTNDRQLHYQRLPVTLFTDMLIAKTRSTRHGNLYAQVFAAPNGWKRVFPMEKKSQVHEALALLSTRDGVPPIIICDGAKEQVLGEFCCKARQADCHIRQTKPYTPQSNFAETAIKELKNGVGRKMFSSQVPKRLWDDCIELEQYLQSNTWNERFTNAGKVPETIVSGETADISTFVQHHWYEWIMFRDTSVSFPGDKLVLGFYLGPSIDVGPAMMAKILKANGVIVH